MYLISVLEIKYVDLSWILFFHFVCLCMYYYLKDNTHVACLLVVAYLFYIFVVVIGV